MAGRHAGRGTNPRVATHGPAERDERATRSSFGWGPRSFRMTWWSPAIRIAGIDGPLACIYFVAESTSQHNAAALPHTRRMDLKIEGVSKTYPNGVQALKDVTLTIPAGMYGLLGPNGAGKSTLMRILATLQEPDGGSVQLGGIDVLNQKHEVRKTLGYLPQEFGVYPKANAEDLLEHFAILKGIAGRRARKGV